MRVLTSLCALPWAGLAGGSNSSKIHFLESWIGQVAIIAIASAVLVGLAIRTYYAKLKQRTTQNKENIQKMAKPELIQCMNGWIEKFHSTDSRSDYLYFAKFLAWNDEEREALDKLTDIHKRAIQEGWISFNACDYAFKYLADLFSARELVDPEVIKHDPYKIIEGGNPYIFELIKKEPPLIFHLSSTHLAIKNSKGESLLRAILNLDFRLTYSWMSKVKIKGINLRAHDSDSQTPIFVLLMQKERSDEIREILKDSHCQSSLKKYFEEHQTLIIENFSERDGRFMSLGECEIRTKMLDYGIPFPSVPRRMSQ